MTDESIGLKNRDSGKRVSEENVVGFPWTETSVSGVRVTFDRVTGVTVSMVRGEVRYNG